MSTGELNLNVRDRANRASERVTAHGRMSHPLHIPQVSDEQQEKSRFPRAEKLMVRGREVSGFVIPHWAAGVLLATVLSGMGVMYNQISGQRDMLIRLDTQLQERDKHEIEYRAEFKDTLSLQQVYINNLTKEVSTIKTILSPQQMRSIERTRKDDN